MTVHAGAQAKPEATVATPSHEWYRTPLGERIWQGYTHAVTVRGEGLLLHEQDIEIVRADGSLDRWANVLPRRVDPFSTVAALQNGSIVVIPGRKEVAFRFDPGTRTSTDLPGFAVLTGRGARAVDDGTGGIICMLAGGETSLLRYRGGRMETLPDVDCVNAPGKYASGLFRLERQLLAFGDHHVSSFDLDTLTWAGTNRLFNVLGFRPAVDRGGMVCQDPESGAMFMTHGKDSRAVGVLLPTREFYYLRPRLPFAMRDSGQALFTTGTGPLTKLNLLSQIQSTLFWIQLTEFEPASIVGREVDHGSRWQVWNLSASGASGDLVRERDSVGNTVFIDPNIYVQRKHQMRTIEYDAWRHSPWEGAPEFGSSFAIKGAALCADGRRIYLTNGYSNEFFCLDLHMTESKQASEHVVPITEALVRPLAPLRSFPAATNNDDLPRNMTMVCHQGKVYALRDPVTRIVHVYDPEIDSWSAAALLPSAAIYSDELGADLMSDGERLLLLSGNTFTTWTEAKGWTDVRTLAFRYSSNGGMAIYDPVAKLIYAALGDNSRDLAVLDPVLGSHRVLVDCFPDAVSVHGRRFFLCERDGERYLNIQRGHDSSEFWRTKVSGDGSLSPR